MSLISFTSQFATSLTRIVQDVLVEDTRNTANYFFVNESYGVTCLVLATQEFKISKAANWKVILEGRGGLLLLKFLTMLKKEFLNPLLLASSNHYAYFQLSTLRTRFSLLGWVLMGPWHHGPIIKEAQSEWQ